MRRGILNREKLGYTILGAGRHLVYLGKRGYQVIGGDISPTALQLSEERLKEEELTPNLVRGDMEHLPLGEEVFDVVINRGVITHNDIGGIQNCVDEMYRVMKPGGLVLTTFISTRSSEYGEGRKVGPRTYVPTEGIEKGVIHHYTVQEEVEDFMSDFSDIEIYHQEHKGLLDTGEEYRSAHWIYIGEKQ